MQTVILLLLCGISLLECLCLLFGIFIYVFGNKKQEKVENTEPSISEEEKRRRQEIERTLEGINAILSYTGGADDGTNQQ